MKKIVTGFFVLIICSFIFAQEPASNNDNEEQNSIQQTNGNYQIGDYELFFMPTAKTMPKHSSYFTDYEAIFFNYTFAPTNRTDVGIFTLFPIINGFVNTITLGVKQNYFNSKIFASAFWVSYTPNIKIITIGNACSLTYKTDSFHLALSSGNKLGEKYDNELIIMAGIKLKYFIVEYTNTKSMFLDNDFKGLITAGIRLGSKKMSVDIALFRSLSKKFDKIEKFPLIKFTYRIK